MQISSPTWLHRLLLALVVAAPAYGQEGPQQLVPEGFALDPTATTAINAAWLTDDERRAMRVFHGVWDDRDLTTLELKAAVALNGWELDHPALSDAATPAVLRAQARLLAGDLDQVVDIVANYHSNAAARLRPEAFDGLGRTAAADGAVEAAVNRLLQQKLSDAAELTEGVRAMFIRARLRGQPARDYQTMMDLLARAHQEIDRLYWPARLAEAELLLDKDNIREAVGALHEALALNPRSSQAWYLLGSVALDRFDFAGANNAIAALRRLNRTHPLADLLYAQSRLVEDDPEGGREAIERVLARYPKMRPALALNAAAQSLFYDETATKAALDRYGALSPGSAKALYAAGKQLSFNRQYEMSAALLEEAARLEPAWPAPQIELGLMELQSGRDDRALAALKRVVALDPFNKRAANSLFLLEELATYTQLESEHFIVRYKPGVDQVLADMMLEVLERIHAIVAGRFQFEPDRKTVIEVLPDHERFGVRITGMPPIHTIAACTGPVIAMEVPREGPPSQHFGVFDWPRVIQHEYTHTITLAQTRNRIPHWLTEAAAVSMEPGPRDYGTCRLLADAHRNGTLFNLDEIKWAFVRPRKPNDRKQAYAQGHWMVQYMNERFGESALVRLLERYFHGEREQQAIPAALGVTRDEFFLGFLEWAGEQVKSWGLAPQPSFDELLDELYRSDPDFAQFIAMSSKARLDAIIRALGEQIGRPASGIPEEPGETDRLTADRWPPLVRPPIDISDEQLAEWVGAHPDHPDLVERQIRQRMDRIDGAADEHDADLIALLEQSARVRPVDPYPHKKLAQIWLNSNDPGKAIEHLEFLDIREEHTPLYAVQLAKLYRDAGDMDKALTKAIRAVHINPYNAPNRELAAAIAIQAAQPKVARQHIAALTLIEPDRPQHAKRLVAIDKMLEGKSQ